MVLPYLLLLLPTDRCERNASAVPSQTQTKSPPGRVSDSYRTRRTPLAETEEANDESKEATFFDAQLNFDKWIQQEEIEQPFSHLCQHFPCLIAVVPVLPFLIIECNRPPMPQCNVSWLQVSSPYLSKRMGPLSIRR